MDKKSRDKLTQHDIYDDFLILLEGKDLLTLKSEFLDILNFFEENKLNYCIGGAIAFSEYISPRACCHFDFLIPIDLRRMIETWFKTQGYELLKESDALEFAVQSKEVGEYQYSFVFTCLDARELTRLKTTKTATAFGRSELPIPTPEHLVHLTLTIIHNGAIFYGRQLECELYELLESELVDRSNLIKALKDTNKSFNQILFNMLDQIEDDKGKVGLSWAEVQKRKKKDYS